MKLYENAPQSIYEEIKTWYPAWYREVLEMDALWRTFGNQLEKIQNGIIQAVDNNFIDYADAQTISDLEHFFHVGYDGSRTLTERRNIIKAMFLGAGHIGRKEIIELMAVFTAGRAEVSFSDGAVQVAVTRAADEIFRVSDSYLALRDRIPAHLALGIVDSIAIGGASSLYAAVAVLCIHTIITVEVMSCGLE